MNFLKHVKPKNVDRETLEWEYDREDVKYWYKNKYSFLFKKKWNIILFKPRLSHTILVYIRRTSKLLSHSIW